MSRAKGRVAASTILDFTLSYPVTLPPDISLGGILRTAESNGRSVLGMVENINIGADPFAARMLARDVPDAVLADLQQRQGNVLVRCLVIGYEQDGVYYRVVSPQPPAMGTKAEPLESEMFLDFCKEPHYLTAVFGATLTIPLAQLIAAHCLIVQSAQDGADSTVLLDIMSLVGETFKRQPETFAAIENALVAAGF